MEEDCRFTAINTDGVEYNYLNVCAELMGIFT